MGSRRLLFHLFKITFRYLVHRFSASLVVTVAAAMACAPLAAQATITPVAGFGTGGWLAPGVIGQLYTSNSQRCMAVYEASRYSLSFN